MMPKGFRFELMDTLKKQNEVAEKIKGVPGRKRKVSSFGGF